jgi:uncharacterized membrane protein
MLYAALKTLHLLTIIVWIGGMFFAHFFLRPALVHLDPARVRLMHDVLGRFFGTVLLVVVLVWMSGSWMIGRAAKQAVQAGAHFTMPVEWMIMAALGGVMTLIFVYIRWALFPKLGRAVVSADWPVGAKALAGIRQWVSVNLIIGVVIVLVTLIGVGR